MIKEGCIYSSENCKACTWWQSDYSLILPV